MNVFHENARLQLEQLLSSNDVCQVIARTLTLTVFDTKVGVFPTIPGSWTFELSVVRRQVTRTVCWLSSWLFYLCGLHCRTRFPNLYQSHEYNENNSVSFICLSGKFNCFKSWIFFFSFTSFGGEGTNPPYSDVTSYVNCDDYVEDNPPNFIWHFFFEKTFHFLSEK